MKDQPTPPVVEHFDGAGWRLVSLPEGPVPFVTPMAVAAVSPNDVWVGGWMAESDLAENASEDRSLVAHWDGSSWSFVDTGLDQPPQILTGATELDGSLWFVGRQDGAFAADQSIENARPLATMGICS